MLSNTEEVRKVIKEELNIRTKPEEAGISTSEPPLAGLIEAAWGQVRNIREQHDLLTLAVIPELAS